MFRFVPRSFASFCSFLRLLHVAAFVVAAFVAAFFTGYDVAFVPASVATVVAALIALFLVACTRLYTPLCRSVGR